MAGETRGALAEAIAKVATELALTRLRKAEAVFWEESPADSVVKPDLTTGVSKDQPSNVILVNASDSTKESEKKFWRNVGEIFDAKARLSPRPTVIGLFFRSEIKPELIRLTATLCDTTHHVDQNADYGKSISIWLEANHNEAPTSKIAKEGFVRSALSHGARSYNLAFAAGVDKLSIDLANSLYRSRDELNSLWDLITADFVKRRPLPARKARQTLLRRGLARWLVFTDADRAGILAAHLSNKPVQSAQTPSYAISLGMLHKRIGGAYIPTDEAALGDMVSTTGYDLRAGANFFLAAAGGNSDDAIQAISVALSDVPDEMGRAAEHLRVLQDHVGNWHLYVKQHWEELRTPEGCFDALMKCRVDPTMGGEVVAHNDGRVWIYDHLVAILRSNTNKNNNFGYGTMVARFKAGIGKPALTNLLKYSMVGLTEGEKKNAERWIARDLRTAAEPGRRGFQEWLGGTKQVVAPIIAAFSYALAAMFREITDLSTIALDDLVNRHAYSFWNKLLTHPDFEPLPALINIACIKRVELVSCPTVMADQDGRTVQDAGWMRAFAFQQGLIYWKSVTDAGKDHKRKELSGRARALRYSQSADEFQQRPNAQRLFLVIDGTFNDEDIRVLHDSGWDRIFYPDEMTELAEAIS